jgi:ribosomal protein S7
MTMTKTKYSNEVMELKKLIVASYKTAKKMGSRCTVNIHLRNSEEQKMVDELAPELGLARDESAPTCWKKRDEYWFYVFDFRP